MKEPKVEIEYIVQDRNKGLTYSICHSPEVATIKRRRADIKYGEGSHIIIRKTTTYQQVLGD